MTEGRMVGQWFGSITGTNNGGLILNVEPDRPRTGLFQVSDAFPFSAIAALEVTGNDVEGELSAFVPQPAAPGVTVPIGGQIITVPTRGHMVGRLAGKSAKGTWETDASTKGEFEINRWDEPKPRLADETVSWRHFRDWALLPEVTSQRALFRGQSAKHPLTTRFHRMKRCNLRRYALEDITKLRFRVEASLGKSYRTEDAYEHGALLSLAQHHGFPTPLLDWSFSPFVAAYFGFRRPREKGDDSPVRIFVFNSSAWPRNGSATIFDAEPRFTTHALGARDNPRAIPQQAVSTFSNLFDIETYVDFVARTEKVERYIGRIDIPATERAEALRELRLMGITAASLFPGLDGMCEALSEECFGCEGGTEESPTEEGTS